MDNGRIRLAALGTAFALFGAVDLLVLLLTPGPQRGAVLIPPIVAAVVVLLTLPHLLSLFERQEERIERQRREIETLHAMDTAIASEVELPRLLATAAEKALTAVDADATGVVLFDIRTGKLEAEAFSAPDVADEAALSAFRNRVRGGGGKTDDDWLVFVAPLIWRERTGTVRPGADASQDDEPAAAHGYLVAARRTGRPAFADADERLLSALAGTVVVAATNAHALAGARDAARMREELYVERRERERERAVAQALTEGLLPEIPPRAGRWAFSMRYQPQSDEAPVGGDIYDLFRLDERRWGVAIADVSGKGLDAARQTAMVKYSLRSYAREHASPARVLERLNDALVEESIVKGFVTLFYGVLDEGEGTFVYGSAGHEPQLLRRGRGETDSPPVFEGLDPTGPVLGALAGVEYRECAVRLGPGDGMLLFTDGLSEARSEEGRFLDREGVERLLSECRDCAPERVADSLLEAARAFTGSRRLSDDTAVLWLEYSHAPASPAEELAAAPPPHARVAATAGNSFASSPGGPIAARPGGDAAPGPLPVPQGA